MTPGYRDRSWPRLLWLLPTALALSLLSLEGFFVLLQGGTYAPLPPKPIDVEVVEVPPSPPPSPPVVETPPPAPALPPAASEAPPVAETPLAAPSPPVAEVPPPVVPAEPAPPARRKTKAPAPAARAKSLPPPAPAAVLPAPASPSPAPAAEPPAVAREREQPESALSPEETAAIEEHRLRLAEALYSPGGTRNTYEGEKALAAGLKPNAPPLTAEQWRALDSIYIVGVNGSNVADYLAEHAPLRAALDIRSPPLTKAQWDELDRIYHVGGYVRYDDYLAARAALKPAHPVRLADLTPDERMMIFARRGIRLPPVVSVAAKVKLLETENPSEYQRRGTPAIPMEAPTPELPPALLKPNVGWLVVARVHVARDGTAELTVTNATPDAAVNRAVEDALRRWRFRPTYIRGYLPQDSTIELSVKISVS